MHYNLATFEKLECLDKLLKGWIAQFIGRSSLLLVNAPLSGG
jgi:hypothetical protein